MPNRDRYSGMAALTICESLLLALNDHKILAESEIMGILQDAADVHGNTIEPEADREAHLAVAKLINQIIAGGNSVRRPKAND